MEGQDVDILTEEEKSHGTMPALAPKDVAAAVLYAISVKENVQVINLSLLSRGNFKIYFFFHFFFIFYIHHRSMRLKLR